MAALRLVEDVDNVEDDRRESDFLCVTEAVLTMIFVLWEVLGLDDGRESCENPDATSAAALKAMMTMGDIFIMEGDGMDLLVTTC